MSKRALLIVLDSVGVGALPDAYKYGDEGSNTLKHIAENTDLNLPNLASLGLGHIENTGIEKAKNVIGSYGRMAENSPGKDTTTGHWEIAGLTLSSPFPTFPNGFPASFMKEFEKAIGTKTFGNKVASGTKILDELGEEHIKTGYPIVYTSADSVFQIAANEEIIPLEKLYEMCNIARNMLKDDMAVARVIARPFVGKKSGGFTRTGARRDFSLTPTGDTMLDVLKANCFDVLAVGKIDDIFSKKGITDSNHAAGNKACIEATKEYLIRDFNGLCFVNLVDFDMLYGHRRDVEGYARALEYFDNELPKLLDLLNDGDLLIITADHGCDPTHKGTDHTREYVPLLSYMKGKNYSNNLGTRTTFADVAATICEYFGLDERFKAVSFLKEMEGNK
ncbi:MAG TPA: phosphopentomutase [Christensenellaceae bacterium]|jgi:phosphopentomutase|nr:phosphopentomutase [Christensenellaceae bacterium]